MTGKEPNTCHFDPTEVLKPGLELYNVVKGEFDLRRQESFWFPSLLKLWLMQLNSIPSTGTNNMGKPSPQNCNSYPSIVLQEHAPSDPCAPGSSCLEQNCRARFLEWWNLDHVSVMFWIVCTVLKLLLYFCISLWSIYWGWIRTCLLARSAQWERSGVYHRKPYFKWEVGICSVLLHAGKIPQMLSQHHLPV